jgi:dienelactone hydrolase
MFSCRTEAGRLPAERLRPFRDEAVVPGLPCGGVPVAAEVTRVLDLPLDVIIVRKLGVPDEPEPAMGAVGEDGVMVLDHDVLRQARVGAARLATAETRERSAHHPEQAHHPRQAHHPHQGHHPRQAHHPHQAHHPEQAHHPRQAHHPHQGHHPEQGRHPEQGEVLLPAAPGELRGDLAVPADCSGLVVFVHGSGSSRHSPRNRYVAQRLNGSGLATLLFDLLTAEEERDRGNVFDIGLLAERLEGVTARARANPRVAGLPIGYFGASTGAAAALLAAAAPAAEIGAVVSRGGRPDLAGPGLAAVRAPTLLLVGSLDLLVLQLNQQAQHELRCHSRLQVVPHAGHLFEEPGTLDVVADAATEWFRRYLRRATAPG